MNVGRDVDEELEREGDGGDSLWQILHVRPPWNAFPRVVAYFVGRLGTLSEVLAASRVPRGKSRVA